MMLMLAAAATWPSQDGSMLRGLAAVMVVVGLVVALAWLATRGRLPLVSRRRLGQITIETSCALGERRSLVVVSVEGRRLLLGMTPVQVSLITELGPASTDAFDRALDAAGEAGTRGHS